jgi:hypothetical protein
MNDDEFWGERKVQNGNFDDSSFFFEAGAFVEFVI